MLYGFQDELIYETAALFAAGHRSVVLQLGTGGGKTHLAAAVIARRLVRKPASRVVFLADLEAILDDTVARLRAAGLHVGLVQADRAADPTAPVQVASLDTLAARLAAGAELPPADLVILDECHGACARTVREVLARYAGALLLGLTATPQRGDGQALGDLFSAMARGPSNAWLTTQGFLVPCHTVGPDAPEKGLACDPLEAHARWLADRRTLVFAPSVAWGRRLAARFVEAGVTALCVDGTSPRAVRAEARDRLAAGELRVLIGVDLFLKGWDCPAVDGLLFARRFSVAGTWLQALGRGARTSRATGKVDCIAVDLCGSWAELGLRDDPRAWSLEGVAARLEVEALPPAMRCTTCAAIFPPATVCPRCGAEKERVERAPRILTRAGKLALVSKLPPAERDRRYLASLVRVAEQNIKLSGAAAAGWAHRRFVATRGREPLVSAAAAVAHARGAA